MQAIKDAVTKASAYLAEHPGEARYRDSHARARLGDGLKVSVSGPSGERLETDMPNGIGGGGTMPSPGWYFRAAAASCVASLIGIRAATLGLEIPGDALEVVVDTESDDRGILGLAADVPAGAMTMRVIVSSGAGFTDRARFEELVRWAVDHCPVTDTAARAIPIEVVIS